jgi:hypothetical protein
MGVQLIRGPCDQHTLNVPSLRRSIDMSSSTTGTHAEGTASESALLSEGRALVDVATLRDPTVMAELAQNISAAQAQED